MSMVGAYGPHIMKTDKRVTRLSFFLKLKNDKLLGVASLYYLSSLHGKKVIDKMEGQRDKLADVLKGIGILSVVPTLITKKFSRWQGALMLAAYAVYIVLSVIVMA